MSQCHKCEYSKCPSLERCLGCDMKNETYSYRFGRYVMEGYDVPQPEKTEDEKPTSLDEDSEDRFRKALYVLFDLSYNELCMLKAIMQGRNLTEFADDMEQMSQMNQTFSRFRAFQTRKAILGKLGDQFKIALTTRGQRKPLKSRPK